MDGNSIDGDQCVTNTSNLNFSHFQARKYNTLVKLTDKLPYYLGRTFYAVLPQVAVKIPSTCFQWPNAVWLSD